MIDHDALRWLVEATIWLAGACALAGAAAGNRVALPLLASLAFRQFACWREWQFDELLWATVDLCALIGVGFAFAWRAIVRKPWATGADMWLVFLFAPLLASYGLEGWTRYYVSNGVMIAQLLLTFPLAEIRTHLRQVPAHKRHDLWKDLDLRVAT